MPPAGSCRTQEPEKPRARGCFEASFPGRSKLRAKVHWQDPARAANPKMHVLERVPARAAHGVRGESQASVARKPRPWRIPRRRRTPSKTRATERFPRVPPRQIPTRSAGTSPAPPADFGRAGFPAAAKSPRKRVLESRFAGTLRDRCRNGSTGGKQTPPSDLGRGGCPAAADPPEIPR